MLCLDHWIAGARDHGCSDRAGTIYIGDTENHRIRKLVRAD